MIKATISTLLLVAALASAQQNCPLPAFRSASNNGSLSVEQEMTFGDILTEQLGSRFHIVKDPSLSAHVQQVGERLLAALPPTSMQYRFVLVDLPVVNAFGMPGGRIYVTRKMVAFLNSDQELAALLAHEIGHIYSRQQAAALSESFRRVLNVTSFGDRDDMLKKYNQLLDASVRKSFKFKPEKDDPNQEEADMVGVYALARAGYDPATFSRFFDRLAQTHGDTGNFFSDLFGLTKPDNQRLRRVLEVTKHLPPDCIQSQAQISPFDFKKWQSEVVQFSEASYSGQALPSASFIQLTPPLATATRDLRFSRDGRYLMAVDAAGATVLKRDPLSVLFRIPFYDTTQAVFSPDSSQISLSSSGLRVETWGISEKKQIAVHELALSKVHCRTARLSPDGKFLACHDRTGLLLLDTQDGSTIASDKHFELPDMWDFQLFSVFGLEQFWLAASTHMEFSPSGDQFVAADREHVFLYDLLQRKPCSSSGALRSNLQHGFTFLTADRIFTRSGPEDHSTIFSFPEGKELKRLKAVSMPVRATSDGKYLLVTQTAKSNAAVIIFDIAQEKVVMGARRPAVDSFGGTFATNDIVGSVTLVGSQAFDKSIASVEVPNPPLSRPIVAFANSLDRIGLSEADFSAIYESKTGKQLARLSAVKGMYFLDPDTVTMLFESDDKPPVSKLGRLDLSHNQASLLQTFEKDQFVRQYGPYLMITTRGHKIDDPTRVKVTDLRSSTTLFEREFKNSVPFISLRPSDSLMLIVWNSFMKNVPSDVHARLSHDNSQYLQLVDLKSGQQVADMSLSGEFVPFAISANRSYAVVPDWTNRVHVYAWKDAREIGSVFGNSPYLWNDKLFTAKTDRGDVVLFRVEPVQQLREFKLGVAIVGESMTTNGDLLVLTQDQKVYTVSTANQ